MSEIDNTNSNGGKRPTFLTVLCILTFIGSGLGIMGSLTMMTMDKMADTVTEQAQEMVDEMNEEMSEMEGYEEIETMAEMEEGENFMDMIMRMSGKDPEAAKAEMPILGLIACYSLYCRSYI